MSAPLVRWSVVLPLGMSLVLGLGGCLFPHGGRAGMALESLESQRNRAPEVWRYPVASILFGVPDGRTWRIVPYEGPDRDAALAWFRTGQPLPHGLFAVARTSTGYEFLTPDMVRWE